MLVMILLMAFICTRSNQAKEIQQRIFDECEHNYIKEEKWITYGPMSDSHPDSYTVIECSKCGHRI